MRSSPQQTPPRSRPPQDSETLEALDTFLMSDRAPEEGMQLSELDGFLTGMALSPRSMSPPDLLSVVWGE